MRLSIRLCLQKTREYNNSEYEKMLRESNFIIAKSFRVLLFDYPCIFPTAKFSNFQLRNMKELIRFFQVARFFA